jgi:predicted enzyme related to lactoylglutathione lyase
VAEPNDEEGAGGATVTPPMDVRGPTIAFFSDPAGNRIGLMKAM